MAVSLRCIGNETVLSFVPSCPGENTRKTAKAAGKFKQTRALAVFARLGLRLCAGHKNFADQPPSVRQGKGHPLWNRNRRADGDSGMPGSQSSAIPRPPSLLGSHGFLTGRQPFPLLCVVSRLGVILCGGY